MRLINNSLLYLLTFGVAGYALFAYGYMPLGSLVHPDMKVNFVTHSVGIYTHIFASILALIIGPFQFSERIRQKYKNVHRWMGRIYLSVGVLLGGLSGLYMSQFAYGGLMAQFGFAMLAVFWLMTGFRAYTAICRGNVDEHRKWMTLNFSLTLAAVSLRIYLPLSMVAGIDFLIAYPIIAWLCWVPNLVLAKWYFHRQQKLIS
jgi:uncharacterized membrane protein